MHKIDMTEILAKKAELGTLDAVQKKLKSLQSQKCRLKKMKNKPDYQVRMTEILQEEQVVKEVRSLLTEKKKSVPDFTQEDVNLLDYEATMKAIKSIQSKKCLSQNDEAEYNRAVIVEKMLLEHKKQVKPVDETSVKKIEILHLLEEVDNLANNQKYKYLRSKLEELIK